MKVKYRMAPCASSDCARMVVIRSRYAAEYCPVCKKKRIRESQRQFELEKRERRRDQLHDPDWALNKKLEEAEFAVVRDAGPEEAAFRPGARLTGCEIRHMLENEALAVNSVLVHVKSQRQHQVLRGRSGHLILDPAPTVSDGEDAKNPAEPERKNSAAIGARTTPMWQRVGRGQAGSRMRLRGQTRKSLLRRSFRLRQQ